MADEAITDLAELAVPPADDDWLVVVDVSDTSMAPTGTDKKVQFSNVATGGAVDSVNTQTGAVVLTASDVGADVSGAAASAVAALSTVYQPLDSDLTAIAALTTTSYGRAFLALANAAAGISALGLDADLATLALPASTTISTFGASLIDDAAASNARTTLGLGTAATSATGDFDAAGAAAAAQSASQPLDSDLTAIAALTTTSFGRGLLTSANAAALATSAGLGSVDNTSDATKNAATATLTNKTLTSPVVNSPTGIVKADVGLGNVDNTADTAKPVSTAQQTALNLKAPLASPTFTGTVTIPTGASITAPTGLVKGDVGLGNVDNTSNATERAATATLTNKTLTSPVVNSPTGIVKGDVGLGNVDNTSNATERAASATLTNKKLSDTTTTIVNASDATKVAKFDLSGATTAKTATIAAPVTLDRTITLPDATDTLVGKATTDTLTNKSIDGSQLTGSVALARLPTGTNSSSVVVGGVITGAGPTGDASHTLALTYNAAGQLTAVTNNAIAIAESAVTNLTTDLAAKAPLASPALTGTPTAPTPSGSDNSTKLATTAYVDAVDVLKAPLASPALTGHPTGVTESAGDNSTRLASTAYADAIAALKANLASPTLTGTPAAPTAAAKTNTTQLATTAYVDTGDDGWILDTDTWVFVSATSFKITGANRTAKFPKGTKVSYNDGSVDYGVVASSAFSTDTTVTLITNADYSIANATLTAPRYSYANPQGFPGWFNWTPTHSGWSANPASNSYRYFTLGNTIYLNYVQVTSGTSNSAAHTLTIPIAAANNTNGYPSNTCYAVDNGTQMAGFVQIAPAGTVLNIYAKINGATNTASGASSAAGAIPYEF